MRRRISAGYLHGGHEATRLAGATERATDPVCRSRNLVASYYGFSAFLACPQWCHGGIRVVQATVATHPVTLFLERR